MKQILIATVVFSVAAIFSGCDVNEESAQNTSKASLQPQSVSAESVAAAGAGPSMEAGVLTSEISSAKAGSSAEAGSSAKETVTMETGREADSAQSTDIVFGDKFPEVLKVDATSSGNGKWRFNVTLSSKYDSPQRYADAWRVLDSKDQELGIRVLGHDHASEQPFTRSGTIKIPSDTKVVYVEGRDQENGWSGQRFEYQMPAQP